MPRQPSGPAVVIARFAPANEFAPLLGDWTVECIVSLDDPAGVNPILSCAEGDFSDGWRLGQDGAAPFNGRFFFEIDGSAGNRKLIEWVRVRLARAEEVSAIQRLQRAPKDRDLRDLLAVHLRIRLKESPLHRMRLARLLAEDDGDEPA